MKLGKKIISSIKNIFSYAVHGESTEDRIRKPQAAQAVLEFSTYVTASGRVGYDDSLRAVLLQVPSKALDALLEKKIAVSLDARLANQELDYKDAAIAGIFYPGSQNAATGGLVSFADNGVNEYQTGQSGVLIENLVKFLAKATPNVPVYAYSTLQIGHTRDIDGVTLPEWGCCGNDKAVAALKNPDLKHPALKAATPKN